MISTITDATLTGNFETGTSEMASLNDIYILLVVIALFMLAFSCRKLFRNMFNNLRGKGEK